MKVIVIAAVALVGAWFFYNKSGPEAGGKAALKLDEAPSIAPGKVAIFSNEPCSACQKARVFFEQMGVPYIDYSQDAEEATLLPPSEREQISTTPVFYYNGKTQVGFDKKALAALYNPSI